MGQESLIDAVFFINFITVLNKYVLSFKVLSPHEVIVSFNCVTNSTWGFSGGSVVKNLPANAGDIRDPGSFSELERSCGGEGMATYPSILAWRIPRTEEPGGLQFIGSQRVRHD